VNDRINGAGHGNQINAITCEGDNIYSCGIDDSFRKATQGEGDAAGTYDGSATALGSQPRAMDIYREKSLHIITTIKEVRIC
jgi:hypothetical protein